MTRLVPINDEVVVASAIQTLVLDAALLEAASALGDAGINFLVLKGPVFAARLFEVSELRGYADLDLLVSRRERGRATEAFERLGYRVIGRGVRADDLVRARDGTFIDLHWAIPGIEAPPSVAWPRLWSHRSMVDVQGTPLPCLDDPGLALLVSLHAFYSAGGLDKPRLDLERAVTRLSTDSWIRAGQLAADLAAGGAFAVGLRSVPAGSALADRLGLPAPDREAVTEVAGAALVHNEIAGASGLERLRVLRRLVVPAPRRLRVRSRLANRGFVGLVLAYVLRMPLLMVRHRRRVAQALGDGTRNLIRERAWRRPPHRLEQSALESRDADPTDRGLGG